jgi:predicted metal-dependent phosphotriesterase family hydrolase
MMKRMGISDEHIHTILVENPRRMLHLVLGPLAANL